MISGSSGLASLANYNSDDGEDLEEVKEDVTEPPTLPEALPVPIPSSPPLKLVQGSLKTLEDPTPTSTSPSPRGHLHVTKAGLVTYDLEDTPKDVNLSYDLEESSKESQRPSKIQKELDLCLKRTLFSKINEPKRGRWDQKVTLPPRVHGQCPQELQGKVRDLWEKKQRSGLDLVDYIERNKAFRNPNIYQKLVQFCKIDEFGTNYPQAQRLQWPQTSFYEALSQAQNDILPGSKVNLHPKQCP